LPPRLLLLLLDLRPQFLLLPLDFLLLDFLLLDFLEEPQLVPPATNSISSRVRTRIDHSCLTFEPVLCLGQRPALVNRLAC